MFEPMHTTRFATRRSFTGLCATTLALGACSTTSPPGPTGTSTPQSGAEQRGATPAALGVERQWLQSWFKDTPVQIAQRGDSAITVAVPVAYCFDTGRTTIKPALAAVLDKVAESLRRMPTLRLPLLAAPEGASGTAALAVQRAVQMQKHLVNRGVAAARLGPPSASTEAAVQLRLEAASPA